MVGAPINADRPPLTRRQYLRELVYRKNKWDEPLSDEDKADGFLGWHERGYLPHCDKPGLVQLATLRLVDSLPASRRGEWKLHSAGQPPTPGASFLRMRSPACRIGRIGPAFGC